MTTQDEVSIWRRVARAAWSWDLWLALAIGVALAATALGDFKATTGQMLTIMLLSATMAGLAWGAATRHSSRLLESDYGELVRIVDPLADTGTLPYYIVTFVGTLGAITAGLGGVVIESLTGWQESVVVGIVSFFASWAVLGVLSLVSLDRWHERNRSRIKALRERGHAELG